MNADQLAVAVHIEQLRLLSKGECDSFAQRRIRDVLNELVAEFSSEYEKNDPEFDSVLFQERCWRDYPASEMLD